MHRLPSILHPSPIILSSHGKAWNATKLGWKYYWRRANHGNHLLGCNADNDNITMRLFHHYAEEERQNDKTKTQNRCSPPTQDIFSSCINRRLPASLYMTPAMIKASQIKVSIFCGMSASTTKSAAFFSTIKDATNSTAASTLDKATTPTQKSEGEHGELETLPASQRARLLFKKYGMVFVGTYLTLYWAVLLTFFFSLDSGILDPDVLSQLFKVSKNFACETADIIGPTGMGHSMDEAAAAYANEVTTEISNDKRTLVDIVSGYMQKWEWSKQYADRVAENPHLANLAVAWFMVKFTEPVRLAAAIMVTPKVAKALGRDVDNSGLVAENK